MKTPLIPTSWGELLDKITILEIKSIRIKNQESLKNIKNELDLLNKIKNELSQCDQRLTNFVADLSIINRSLWDIEDRLRKKEHEKVFDSDFIALARSVYKENDKRAKVKREINDYLNSQIIEEKSYSSY